MEILGHADGFPAKNTMFRSSKYHVEGSILKKVDPAANFGWYQDPAKSFFIHSMPLQGSWINNFKDIDLSTWYFGLKCTFLHD